MYILKKYLKTYILLILTFLLSNVSILKSQNTILISIDGIRSSDIELMPFVNGLAQKGVKSISLKPVFPSQTLPNFTSILTGKLPKEHGISANVFKNKYLHNNFGTFDFKEIDPKWISSKLLWTRLKELSINTIAIDYPISSLGADLSPSFLFSKKDSNIIQLLESTINNNQKNFVAIYFSEADNFGHKFGLSSQEYKSSLLEIDQKIKEIALIFNDKENTNIIIHSTFGMVEYQNHKQLYLNEILEMPRDKYINLGTMCLVYDIQDEVYVVNNINDNYFIYDEIPDYLNSFTEYNKPDVLLLAKEPFLFVREDTEIGKLKAVHGYDAESFTMHGFFTVFGSNTKNSYQIGTFNIVNIYDLILSYFDITTENFNEIEHILDLNSKTFEINSNLNHE